MADIFLSYAREDKVRASQLAATLEAEGWTVWWDRQIPAGKTFDEVIEHYLEMAKCVVVLWSNASVFSEWVKNEASIAVERGVLVPVVIDRVKLPLEFRRRQTVELLGWKGDPTHEGFEALCDGISAITKGTTPRTKLVKPQLQSLTLNRRWLVGLASIVLVAVCIAAYLLLLRRPLQVAPLISGDVIYSGTANWRSPRAGPRAHTTKFDLYLYIDGVDVEARYTDSSGDTGTLQLKIKGNSIVGDIVSETEGGRCPWRGTLSKDGSKLDATYHCPDGERGELRLVRQ